MSADEKQRLQEQFAPEQANMPVPVPVPVKNRAVSVSKSEEFRFEKTRSFVMPEVPTPAKLDHTVRTNAHLSATRAGDLQQAPQAAPDLKPAASYNKNYLGIAFVALMMAAGTFLFLSGESSPDAKPQAKAPEVVHSKLDRQALQEKVEYYRQSTGWRLNHERIAADTQNALTAPSLDASAVKVTAPDMMRGLPLQGETYNGQHFKGTITDISKPDMIVQKIMAEDQFNLELQKRQDAAYDADFKANIDRFVTEAHERGFNVKIDENSGHIWLENIGHSTDAHSLDAGSLPPLTR